jgi:hypothetical protein
MKIKIFSFADNVAALEKAVNDWLSQSGNYNEILSTKEISVYDDFTKKVVTTVILWYK